MHMHTRAGMAIAAIAAAALLLTGCAPGGDSEAATAAAKPAADTTITIDQGTLTGVATASGVEYLGLPYAKPPVGDGPWPGVVVLHEAFGLTDDIREHTGRLAAAGYLAVAPDLFRGRGMRRCIVATFKALRTERGRPFDDIDAVRRMLAERGDCTGKVGVIGFCMGGGFALLAAGPLGPVLRVAGIGHHEPSAQDAWERILRFFGQHLAN